MEKTYTVDVTAYNHVATLEIRASSEEEAIQKAMAERNISLKVRAVREP